MNICFFIGKIISDVKFDFIISKDKSFKNCKNTSIAKFDLILANKTIIKIICYDELADFCYSNLKLGDIVFVSGIINENFELNSKFCEII